MAAFTRRQARRHRELLIFGILTLLTVFSAAMTCGRSHHELLSGEHQQPVATSSTLPESFLSTSHRQALLETKPLNHHINAHLQLPLLRG
jgi:hypothetical protein